MGKIGQKGLSFRWPNPQFKRVFSGIASVRHPKSFGVKNCFQKCRPVYTPIKEKLKVQPWFMPSDFFADY